MPGLERKSRFGKWDNIDKKAYPESIERLFACTMLGMKALLWKLAALPRTIDSQHAMSCCPASTLENL
jgi:hypothetical protein